MLKLASPSLFDLKGNLSEISIVCDILARFPRNHLTEGTRDEDMTGFNPVSLLHNTIDHPQGGFPLIAHSLRPLALVECLPIIIESDANFVEIHSLVRPRRYLWTDAFAVCNFLGLYQETGGEEFKDLALKLVDQVHDTLGRHRKDDSRTGWISGLDEEDGRLHPTKGGLRIGKQLQERGSNDPFNERLEWDRDGQYHHYLTKWMHTLNRVSRVTGDLKFNTWAVEPAKPAHARFVYALSYGGPKRMNWKMSIDLSRPLVPSMGQHDPLDGFVTYNELQATATKDPKKSMENDLRAEIFDITNICEGRSWAIHSQPLMSVFRPGTFLISRALATITSALSLRMLKTD